ncbi:Acyl-coenzyme A:6-aminopenicillanic-acid-acyltransferase 40 kDa form, putative [Talaromyces stipitatus ATCC 10500]|uniref:Acyl-coenzyme A:6-aminopenicillanic-acid-acyltransferase 40 kDa form, putative n=1 Tax=Talaromyces stipitatus (strain ATCC 10500 / CBS 375.48 / QM 6759 / NRRL 1006) TaxID=441959 RepID=B8MG24_TALSN|nr:Acyl-coenzyme A:6-aminopenicillanic-acid-acyltransferase 40 kDa form, putative [Talaromyces stipitatus ATCC 10500]EED15891.1 Acyl-coenzyme A:6-aminopenicillanic-acid-acyltransferase 40 kDa form, putative [Talaromyces stipitatus ATCC 10500]
MTHKHPKPHVATLQLRGSSPYEIGLQHGQLAKEQIHNNIKTYTTFFQETAGMKSWEKAKGRSKVFVPTLERLYPEILEEIQGIADGAQLDEEDILALNVRSEIGLTNYSNTPKETFPTIRSPDGSTVILAQNWDWLELHDGIVIMDIITPDGKTRLQFLNEAELVGKIGVNSHGVGICMNALRCGALSLDRLPTHIMCRRVLHCGIARAVRWCLYIQSRHRRCGGKFATVEISPNGLSVIHPLNEGNSSKDIGKGRGFVAHTNHVMTPHTAFSRGPIYDRPAPNSFSRLERITELTEKDLHNMKNFTFESVIEQLKDQKGTPVSICRDRPANATGMERMTTLATVSTEFDIVNKKVTKTQITIGRQCEDGLQLVELAF